MKKLFLALILSIVYGNSYTQNTYPIPQPGSIWGSYFHDLSVGQTYDDSYYYNGDTLLCGITWGKLYKNSSNTLYKLVREDSGVVITRSPYLSCLIPEDTLLNFNLAMGQAFYRFGLYMGVVDSIGSITVLNGQLRKYIRLSNNFNSYEWVEGIGDLKYGLIGNLICIDGIRELACHYDSSGIVHYNSISDPSIFIFIKSTFIIPNS